MKQSAQMIAEKTMGYGYGMFEENYNLRQADYSVSKIFWFCVNLGGKYLL